MLPDRLDSQRVAVKLHDHDQRQFHTLPGWRNAGQYEIHS